MSGPLADSLRFLRDVVAIIPPGCVPEMSGRLAEAMTDSERILMEDREMGTMEGWTTRRANEAAERAGRDEAMKIVGGQEERARLRGKVEALRAGRQVDLDTIRSPFIAGEISALERVLAFLAEPGEEPPAETRDA